MAWGPPDALTAPRLSRLPGPHMEGLPPRDPTLHAGDKASSRALGSRGRSGATSHVRSRRPFPAYSSACFPCRGSP